MLHSFTFPSWFKVPFNLPKWSYYLLATLLYIALIPLIALVSYIGFMRGVSEHLNPPS